MEPILLIRHAHPEDPADITFTSHWTDTNLSPRGRREAQLLAERLERELEGRKLSVISSDLKRASQTAQTICDRLHLAPPIPARELREFNGGIGGSIDAIKDSARRAALAPLAHPSEADGESWADFYLRVSNRMERILKEQTALTLVVSHYGTIIQTLNWWTGLALNAEKDSPLGFGSTLTAISLLLVNNRGKRILDRVNDTAHLHAAGLGLPLFTR